MKKKSLIIPAFVFLLLLVGFLALYFRFYFKSNSTFESSDVKTIHQNELYAIRPDKITEPSAEKIVKGDEATSSFEMGAEKKSLVNHLNREQLSAGLRLAGGMSKFKPIFSGPETFAGLLTGGEINDFSKWKLWESKSRKDLGMNAQQFGIEASERFCVQVLNNQKRPLPDAKVVLQNQSGKILAFGKTDNTGKTELWMDAEKSKNEKNITAFLINRDNTRINLGPVHPFSLGINSFKTEIGCQEKKTIDIAFVVDATGSMSDEIDYLKAELTEMISTISAQNKNSTIRIASVFYRDVLDRYTVEKLDFQKDISKVQDFINEHNADGGGDSAEALDSGFAVAASELTWSDDAISRIAFIVADAPPHNKSENNERLQRAIADCQAKGIRVVPLVCSGVDKNMEFLMRNIALLTNGTYLLLTDKSGIGDKHLSPETNKFTNKKLNKLLIQVVNRFSKAPRCRNEEPAATDTAITAIERSLMNGTQIMLRPYDNNTMSETENKFVVYPNPSQGLVNIKSSESFDEIQVFDISGKVIFRTSAKEKEMSMDLSILPVGKYLLKIMRSDKAVASKWVIIQK